MLILYLVVFCPPGCYCCHQAKDPYNEKFKSKYNGGKRVSKEPSMKMVDKGGTADFGATCQKYKLISSTTNSPDSSLGSSQMDSGHDSRTSKMIIQQTATTGSQNSKSSSKMRTSHSHNNHTQMTNIIDNDTTGRTTSTPNNSYTLNSCIRSKSGGRSAQGSRATLRATDRDSRKTSVESDHFFAKDVLAHLRQNKIDLGSVSNTLPTTYHNVQQQNLLLQQSQKRCQKILNGDVVYELPSNTNFQADGGKSNMSRSTSIDRELNNLKCGEADSNTGPSTTPDPNKNFSMIISQNPNLTKISNSSNGKENSAGISPKPVNVTIENQRKNSVEVLDPARFQHLDQPLVSHQNFYNQNFHGRTLDRDTNEFTKQPGAPNGPATSPFYDNLNTMKSKQSMSIADNTLPESLIPPLLSPKTVMSNGATGPISPCNQLKSNFTHFDSLKSLESTYNIPIKGNMNLKTIEDEISNRESSPTSIARLALHNDVKNPSNVVIVDDDVDMFMPSLIPKSALETKPQKNILINNQDIPAYNLKNTMGNRSGRLNTNNNNNSHVNYNHNYDENTYSQHQLLNGLALDKMSTVDTSLFENDSSVNMSHNFRDIKGVYWDAKYSNYIFQTLTNRYSSFIENALSFLSL